MKRFFSFTSLLLACVLLLTGCGNSGKVTNRKGPQGEVEYRYELTISKSSDNSEVIELLSENKEMSLADLMDLSEISFDARESEGVHQIFELEGVVATARHEWLLYVDDVMTSANLDTEIIKPKHEIEWKYELTKNQETDE